MTADFRAYDAHVDRHADQYVAELFDLCRLPSVSMSGDAIADTAGRLIDSLRAIGAEAETLNPGDPFPVVLGSLGRGNTTLLLYDHYDVQPPGPLAGWHTPPFEPQRRGGLLYGRGVGDDKGQIVARLRALSAWQEIFGELPCCIRYLIEGAHEIGSPGLAEVVAAHGGRLRANACLSEGLGSTTSGTVTLYLGCRGLAYIELICQARDRVAASMYGGLLADPAARLARALASLFDSSGLFAVDELADWVAPLAPADEVLLGQLPLAGVWPDGPGPAAGAESPGSERDRLRRFLFQPAASVCSLQAGDPDWGLVIPGRAAARLDLRLVPNLTPEQVVQLLRKHLDRRGFGDVEIVLLAGVGPDRCPPDAPIVSAAARAAQDLTGTPPITYPLMPAYGVAQALHVLLATPVLFAGAVTHSGSNLHAPDENIRLEDFLAYIKFFGRLIWHFAHQSQ